MLLSTKINTVFDWITMLIWWEFNQDEETPTDIPFKESEEVIWSGSCGGTEQES